MSSFHQFDFSGKKALVRVDYNVPLDAQFQVTDSTRIKATLPTLTHILESGGSAVLMAHLGRPKNGHEDRFSLKHVVSTLEQLSGKKVHFGGDCISEEAFAKSAALQPGEILLLDNLRFYSEETNGDAAFAEKLSAHGDVYVNDAFGTAHRAHASTAVIAKYFDSKSKTFGALMEKEVVNATKVLKEAERPFTAILGGAKVSGKILIIEMLLDVADCILIGGGMSYTFAAAMGGKIGNSLVEEDRMETALAIIEKAKAKGVELLLPQDSLIADDFNNEAKLKVSENNQIPDGWMGLDIGPKAIEAYRAAILRSKTILWNGPMGVFEMENFQKGTKAVADAVAEATAAGAFSLVGGGDSVAAVNKFGYSEKVSYVSTGGGAMLEFFEGKDLPGIAAIKES
ncbi:MAG: phosphoglycerate kinase [Limisphaerales bacterium]|jgi:phosphoglycerate kinase